MKTLIVALILSGLSLPAHAVREEGSQEMSSVAASTPDESAVYQRTWSGDSFVIGSRMEVISEVEGLTREGCARGAKTCRDERIKSAQANGNQ